ncbi:MAG TPA: Mu transposase C-terminal domain-containing protein [Ktedonobacteraceae bacterium]
MIMEFPTDLETAKSQEADRRLKLLGPLTAPEADAHGLHLRARQTRVPPQILSDWRKRYLARGIQGLLPDDWAAVTLDDQKVILEHFALLGDLAHAETITWAAVEEQAKHTPYSKWTVERWLSRYRAGGLWGLAREAHLNGNPGPRKYPARPLRAPGTLKDKDFDEIERKYDLLGELAQKAKRGEVSNLEVKKVAEEKGVSVRTLWDYIHDLRQYGLFGLAPQKRSDYEQHHNISPRMVLLIQGMRLSKRNCTVRDALEMARVKASLLGQVEPSEWQVRAIFDEIPAPVKCLADGKEEEFGDKYRFTHRLVWDPSFMVMAIDHVEPLHIYVKDLRIPRDRAKSGETRPYLTLAMDFPTRAVPAYRLSYDKPDRFNVAATLRDCFLPSPLKPFVAVPHQAKVDNGKALNARHVRLFATDLDIDLETCDPHDPQARAILERMNRTVNTELLATLSGYIDPKAHLPHTPAKLTMEELDAKLLEFFIKHNHTKHSETNAVPFEFWLEEYLPQPVDPRKLDLLLLERIPLKVHKEGIKHGKRIYWHPVLHEWVNKWITIRKAPGYPPPDSVEVFDDEVWICTADAFDSPAGRVVTAQEVGQAQRDQRRQARLQIQQGRQAVEAAEKEIQALEPSRSRPAEASVSTPSPTKGVEEKESLALVSSQLSPAGIAPAAPPSTKESAGHSPAGPPSRKPQRAARPKATQASRQNLLDLLTQRRHTQEGDSRQ